MFKWDLSEFYTTSGEYLDRAQSPLFNTYHSLYNIRKDLLRAIPKYSKVFKPFVESCSTFLIGSATSGAFNQSYAPYTVLYYVIRDYLQDFIELVDGTIIESENAYNKTLNDFNNIFDRVLKGGGRGTIPGFCTEDEMIRIGSLFYILQTSCDHSKGLILNSDQLFMNDWRGRRTQIDLDHKAMEQLSLKLKDVVMSDMNWKKFIFRYIDKTDDETLWLFNIPDFLNLDTQMNINKAQDFDSRDLVNLVDFFPSISARGGKALAVVRKNELLVAEMAKMFNLRYAMANTYRGDGIYMRNEIGGNDDYAILSNFLLETL